MREGTHTHVVRAAIAEAGSVPNDAIIRIAFKQKLLEVMKRMLEGGEFDKKSLVQTYKIESLTPDVLKKNAESNDILKAVKTLLTGSGDRNAAAASLDKIIGTVFGSGLSSRMDTILTPEYFLEIFPSNNRDWADGFLNILLFWTGSTTRNFCVLTDSTQTNFTPYRGTDTHPNNGKWFWAMGVSPLILLSTANPVTLTPAFEGTKIVYAEQQFTDGKGWELPAGKKQPLYYRYDFTEPFSKSRAGEMCVKQANLPDLVAAVGKRYQLTAEEAVTLSRELTAEFPSTADFVKLSLANPADIAARFSWQGDGKPLSLLQLFFEFTPGGCIAESITPPALDIPAARDGFEVGIIE